MSKQKLSKLLLNWYAQKGRNLPWRVKGKSHPDPYIVLVSEMMLQQTGVKTVISYFERFMKRFPTIWSLADASLEEVYLYWQGLGYYSRARSLHASAQIIANDLDGNFPQEYKELLKLKGVGPYTAASILALAFNLPETIIDGNVIRVICRLYNLSQPVEEIGEIIREKAEALTDHDYPGDYASAIIDLGATICTPRKPNCLACPWQKNCLAYQKKNPESIPIITKLTKKIKQGSVYLIANDKGEIFIVKRKKGLLSGLYEFPWCEKGVPPFAADFIDSGLEVSHIFTHLKLNLKIYFLKKEEVPLEGAFVSPVQFSNYPFSTLMKKVYQKAKNYL
jgi:A/G-specific adenine glycosylase